MSVRGKCVRCGEEHGAHYSGLVVNEHFVYIAAGGEYEMLTFEQAQAEAAKRDDYNPAAWVRPPAPVCLIRTFDRWLAGAGVWREPLKKYWLSWRHTPEVSPPFELQTPWWESGEDMYGRLTICAAVHAAGPIAAMLRITHSYADEPDPNELIFRFIDEKAPAWHPFSERFPRADWMVWV